MSGIVLNKMAETEYPLHEAFLNIIKEDSEYGIYLLQGKELIFFPA